MNRPYLASLRIGVVLASALSCVLVLGGAVRAQSEPQLQGPVADETQGPRAPAVDPNIQQTSGCCGMKPLTGMGGYGGCAGGGCANGQCVPGRICHGCDPNTISGRLFGGLYGELCCPDPCYEPSWIPAANAAFFQDGPRPVTQTRIRWDEGRNYGFPDTSEYFWAKIGGKGPKNPTPSLNYSGFTFYQEIAAKAGSVFFELPYLSVDPINNPGAGGFGDMNIGFKSVLFDRELFLLTMQLRTYIPTGNFTAGLGTGHVSLEPSLLAALKLTQSTYLQTQLTDWVPLGGTSGFEGSVFSYHVSLNQNLCHQGDCINVVGVLELNGYSYRGQFTDFPSGAAVGIGGSNYVNAGPGIRFQFCDRFDLGVGTAFGFGNGHGPAQIYRTEMRIRF